MILGVTKGAQALGVSDYSDIRDSALSLFPSYRDSMAFLDDVLANIRGEREILDPILISQINTKMDHILMLCNPGNDENLSKLRFIPLDSARKHPDLSALWIWAHSRGLTDPHEGKKALNDLSINAPFFNGFRISFEGMINYDPEKCLSGMKLMRNDSSINNKLGNYIVSHIEIVAKKM